MDAQRKKGILDVCVLAVLKKGPSYGYLIIRDISRCIDISESTLYPILKRLEQNGSLRTYRQEYNGRTRKYYELTEVGQRRIDVFLEEWDELQRMYHFIEEENQREPEVQEQPEDGTPQSAEDSAVGYVSERESEYGTESAAAEDAGHGADRTSERSSEEAVNCTLEGSSEETIDRTSEGSGEETADHTSEESGEDEADHVSEEAFTHHTEDREESWGGYMR